MLIVFFWLLFSAFFLCSAFKSMTERNYDVGDQYIDIEIDYSSEFLFKQEGINIFGDTD